ncbi:hypothetical protein [Streptomyces sp. AM8-1-1]|uniref:hypothetical protein n=1 Tax=Streptomyces sp. AM8-1-1 TaxID=3075825 RepID=UPI0028C3DE7C|nr:hypothetical protein [Streptomyces sp. AM8-1-1]WNO70141.1 hypothetical protein RPQ07_00135 [Streptomyces sp. AM8-1-1]WNO76975.1 hypothetical protein RPQ07_37590 [Streptomyces sp. AM8-1-1]
MHPPVPRTWTVELRPHNGRPALHCPRCAPQGQLLHGTSARPAALAHLARHARSDALPAHLRVCQCHERGCRWHPRHRGCAGPILLVLTRDHGGRLWRLADVCAACANATPYAAAVPDTAFAGTPAQPRGGDDAGSQRRKRSRRSRGPSEQVRIQDVLSYLAAALSPQADPKARLLALQCALRADARGHVQLPTGLLRSMRLAHDPTPWRELEHHRWLHTQNDTTHPGRPVFIARLVDAVSWPPARPDRLQAANWALHVTSAAHVRVLPAGVRLAALALAAHGSPAHPHTGVEADRLSRACGTQPAELEGLLNRLVIAGAITTWAHDPHTDELHWAPMRPATRLGG